MTQASFYVVGVSRDGFAGYGVHGYTYLNEVPKRGTGNAKVIPSVIGYVAKTNNAVKVTPLEYIDHYRAIDQRCPPNAAALVAVAFVLQRAVDNKITNLSLSIGSPYVYKYMDDYISRGVPVNRQGHQNGGYGPEWASILEVWLELQATACEVTMHLIPVDESNPGIAKASLLAMIGSFEASKESYSKELTRTPPQGYWNPSPEINPLLSLKKMYFYTSPDHQTPGLYFLGTNMMSDEFEGKRSNDTTYSIALLKKPDPVLELLRSVHIRKAGGINTMMMVMLPKAFQSSVYTDLLQHGDIALEGESVYRHDLTHASGTLITREFRPMGLAARAMEAIEVLYASMSEFQTRKSKRQVVTDVTASFYDQTQTTTKDGEIVTALTLKKDFGVGVSSVKVDVNYSIKARTGNTRLELIFGTDLPDRNPLKRLEADTPSIYVVTEPSGESSFQFFVVIETQTGDKSIWFAPFTSFRVMSK